MNKELAKTLTLALVNYIDENRPEGTMDCSSAECESIEEMFEGECFDIIEAFIQKKLTRLTEFELRLLDWLSTDTSGEVPMEKMTKVVKNRAAILLDIAKKELARQGEVITLNKLPPYDKGFQDGKAEALKGLPRWRVELGDMEYVAYGIIGGGVASEENPRVYLDGHSIDLYSLEKLPGFNED